MRRDRVHAVGWLVVLFVVMMTATEGIGATAVVAGNHTHATPSVRTQENNTSTSTRNSNASAGSNSMATGTVFTAPLAVSATSDPASAPVDLIPVSHDPSTQHSTLQHATTAGVGTCIAGTAMIVGIFVLYLQLRRKTITTGEAEINTTTPTAFYRLKYHDADTFLASPSLPSPVNENDEASKTPFGMLI